MKSYHALIVFLLLALSASITSVHSYKVAKNIIITDMNQALEQTLAHKTVAWITPDTIQNYKQNLKIEALKNESFITYAQTATPQTLCSKPMIWKEQTAKPIAFQSYATCSFATIWKLSDQRLSAFFCLLLMLWTTAYAFWHRKQKNTQPIIGTLIYAKDKQCFIGIHHETIRFTPMQTELMQLFLSTPDLKLSKQTICDHLWHKKPDASDTLYTLVRRLRLTLQEHAKCTISSDNKGYYELKQL